MYVLYGIIGAFGNGCDMIKEYITATRWIMKTRIRLILLRSLFMIALVNGSAFGVSTITEANQEQTVGILLIFLGLGAIVLKKWNLRK